MQTIIIFTSVTMRRYLILIFTCLLAIPVVAAKRAEEMGDSIYDRLVEYSIKGEIEQLLKGKETALDLFKTNSQWSDYPGRTTS